MAQQIINIGSAPNDGTGDPNRTAWDKTNDNFTELYAGAGGVGGLWNYNKTDVNTSTAPVSGRFKTNSGDYRNATQIAIHGTTIQGISRANTLRTLLIGDIIQCQDSTNGAAWCRYVVQALPVDNTTWFQINVTLETDGGVASGDNQEIIFTFTANVSSGGGGAPIDSPTFTGDPKAPTPSPGDNDTSIATTAFVTAADNAVKNQLIGSASSGMDTMGEIENYIIANINPALGNKADIFSPTFTGNPKAPTPTAGDNDTSIATTAFVVTAVAATGASSFGPPQGRLTLQTATPVMTTTQSAKTTIFYTPYVGNQVPLYNGTAFTMTTFAELSQATTDTTKSPAAVAASSVYDLFVWDDAGTIRCTRGPAWTNDTTRSAGTALVTVNGIDLNNVAITNGPGAQRGTYVGSVRSNASSQIDWIFGIAGSPSIGGWFGIWNKYNRVVVGTSAKDATASWTYNSTTVRQVRGSSGNQVAFLSGGEDGASASYSVTASGGASGDVVVGIGLDSLTSYVAAIYGSFGTNSAGMATNWAGMPGLGFHTISANESQVTTASSATFFGTVTHNIMCLSVSLRM